MKSGVYRRLGSNIAVNWKALSFLLIFVSASSWGLTPSVTNVTYCSPGGVAQLLDIYNPTNASAGPWPLVIFMHGGAWTGGDKSKYPSFVRQIAGGIRVRGWAFASINYRLAPAYRFPAQIEDAKCAVRFLRANAVTYNLDPTNFLVAGVSAGAHLAMLVAAAGPSAGWDVGEWPGVSSAVSGVWEAYGPADLSRPNIIALLRGLLKEVFGTDDPAVLLVDSPVYYLSEQSPPFMIVHGQLDCTIPPDQAVELNGMLVTLGVSVGMTLVANAGHGLLPGSSLPTYPSNANVASEAVGFLTVF